MALLERWSEVPSWCWQFQRIPGLCCKCQGKSHLTQLFFSFHLKKTTITFCRGNLELVHPRALTLHLARCQLDEGRLDLAMELLRCNRVNLNLLVDHDPVAFLQGGGVANFVRQVDNPQRICLFIADLQ